MENKDLKSLLQEVKQLKENLQNIEQSVSLINSILLQQQIEDEAKKMQKLNHQQLEDEANYKNSNTPPIELSGGQGSNGEIIIIHRPEPQEPHFEESYNFGNSAKYGIEW